VDGRGICVVGSEWERGVVQDPRWDAAELGEGKRRCVVGSRLV
jgi:hypothetical protein